MAFRNKKKAAQEPAAEKPAKKPTPAFLREDYPYQAVGEAITDMSMVREGVIYEIKCHECEMSIRSQGQNIRSTYERMKNSGCIGCGNKNLVVMRVDMSKEPQSAEAKDSTAGV